MQRAQRRPHVLIEPNSVVARKLRAAPDEWWLVGYGSQRDARVLAQTAFRIKTGGLAAFMPDAGGKFEAICTADQSRPDALAPVEAYARYVRN